MKPRFDCWVAACVSTMMSAGLSHAQEYYRQNPINSVGGYSSQDARNPGGLGWFSEVADNFPGQSGWSIDRIEFWGGYVTAPGNPGNTRGFSIRFYTDNEGRPGSRIYHQDVMQFTRTQYYVTPPSPPTFPDGIAGYRYELDLPTPFAISSAGQYWISIVAILDRGGGTNEPQWGWVASITQTPPLSHQWFFSPGNFAPTTVDSAFVLSRTQPSGCTADVDDGSGTGTPDGGVTIEDMLYYLFIFDAGLIAADIDDGSATGTTDGGVTIDDLLYFLVRFDAGC